MIQDSLGERQLAALPVIGRDARVSVELTQPGAVIAENGNNGRAFGLTVRAEPLTTIRSTEPRRNEYLTGNAAVLPSVENLQEYSNITSTAGAEYGTSAEAISVAVIKSGTNQLHGMVWTYFQNSGLNANSWEGNRSGTQRPTGSQTLVWR